MFIFTLTKKTKLMKNIKNFEEFLNEGSWFDENTKSGQLITDHTKYSQNDLLKVAKKLNAIYGRLESFDLDIYDGTIEINIEDQSYYYGYSDDKDCWTGSYHVDGELQVIIPMNIDEFLVYVKDAIAHLGLNESLNSWGYLGEGRVNEAADGYFIAQIAAAQLTSELDKNLTNLQDWNDEYDMFSDWDEDGDQNINQWANKKLKDAGVSVSNFSDNFQAVWFENSTKEQARKKIENLMNKGFSYYGIFKDRMGYRGMEIVVVTKKPLKTKEFSANKSIDDILTDRELKELWGMGEGRVTE